MGLLVRPRQSLEYRGEIIYNHVYSKDSNKCVTCGQKRPSSRRKAPIVLAMTLVRGWRLSARPLSYRVERLKPCIHSPGGNPVWTEVQRLPRTRNTWVDQEFDAAVAMFERRFWEAQQLGTHHYEPETKPTLGGFFAPDYVKRNLMGWPRWRYCLRILLPALWWEWRWYMLKDTVRRRCTYGHR